MSVCGREAWLRQRKPSVTKPQFKQLSTGLLSHHCDSDVETTLPIQDLVTNIVSSCTFICFCFFLQNQGWHFIICAKELGWKRALMSKSAAEDDWQLCPFICCVETWLKDLLDVLQEPVNLLINTISSLCWMLPLVFLQTSGKQKIFTLCPVPPELSFTPIRGSAWSISPSASEGLEG